VSERGAQQSCQAAITLPGDLHARPAGALAAAAARFDADVELTVVSRSADARSVLAIMGLGATSGQRIVVSAVGPDAEPAVAALIGILAEATRVGADIPRDGRGA